MRLFLLVLIISVCITTGFAQANGKIIDKDTAYTSVINARAKKIVATIGITDSLKANHVKNIIANQYRNLNDIQTLRDTQIKAIKVSGGDKDAVNEQVKKIENEADSKITALHCKFLSALSKELTPKQVDQVKDGLTYNVVHVTFNGYTQMIPELTDKQKEQIMAWLVEAREHAMDAGSSEKKHAWFGKYKGRINNYLSAQGYDLKKEGQEWEKRRNEAKVTSAK